MLRLECSRTWAVNRSRTTVELYARCRRRLNDQLLKVGLAESDRAVAEDKRRKAVEDAAERLKRERTATGML